MKEELKTIKEWYESVADEELRNKLLANLHPDNIKRQRTSLELAITGGFNWVLTKEGCDFWSNTNLKARNNQIPLITPMKNDEITEAYTNASKEDKEVLKRLFPDKFPKKRTLTDLRKQYYAVSYNNDFFSKARCQQSILKSELQYVADCLNKEYVRELETNYYFQYNTVVGLIITDEMNTIQNGTIRFNSKAVAEEALEMLGEELIIKAIKEI